MVATATAATASSSLASTTAVIIKTIVCYYICYGVVLYYTGTHHPDTMYIIATGNITVLYWLRAKNDEEWEENKQKTR